MGENLGI